MAKVGVKTANKSRVIAPENWKDSIDLMEIDQDEWDEWLESPGAAASGGQGRVRFVRADTRIPVLRRGGQ